MARKRQPRASSNETRPGVAAQLSGVGRTALLVALGAAVKTARAAPAVLAELASSAEQFLHARKPPPVTGSRVPTRGLDDLFRQRLEQVLASLAVPTQRDLARLSEELHSLQQHVDNLASRAGEGNDDPPAGSHDHHQKEA